MQERVAREDWPLPYLRDESQDVARAFRGQDHADLFVLDAGRVLRHRGAPDADYDDPGMKAPWLRDALDAVLAGECPRARGDEAGRLFDRVEVNLG